MVCASAEAAAAKLQEHKSADEEYIAEQLQLMGLDPQDGYSADGDANAESDSDSSRDDPEGRGLEAFEDVLSSWLTAAHTKTSRPMVKAQASLPLRPKIVGQSGVQSTLQRIQEQQQQMVQEEAEGAVKPASKKETGGKRPAQQVAQETATAESKEDSDDEDGSGVAGWTDVMSDWMSAAGIQGRAQHAQHALVGSKPAAKVLPQQRLQVDAAATPNWLADVSSDEDSDADKKAVAKQQESGSVQAPSTASLSEAKPHKSSPPASQSPSLLNCAPGEAESAAQHAQHATVQQSISNFGLPSLPSKPAMSGNTEPASPKPALAEAMHDSSSSGASSQGVSSQDRRVVSDMMSKAQSDPPAFWPSPSQSYPALMPKGNQGPLQLPIAASSLPPPLVYSADQGLAPQVIPCSWLVPARILSVLVVRSRCKYMLTVLQDQMSSCVCLLVPSCHFLCFIKRTAFAPWIRLPLLQGADFRMITKRTSGQLAQNLVISCILLPSVDTAGVWLAAYCAACQWLGLAWVACQWLGFALVACQWLGLASSVA